MLIGPPSRTSWLFPLIAWNWNFFIWRLAPKIFSARCTFCWLWLWDLGEEIRWQTRFSSKLKWGDALSTIEKSNRRFFNNQKQVSISYGRKAGILNNKAKLNIFKGRLQVDWFLATFLAFNRKKTIELRELRASVKPTIGRSQSTRKKQIKSEIWRISLGLEKVAGLMCETRLQVRFGWE